MELIYMISEANPSPISINKDMSVEKLRFKDLTKTDVIKSCWLSYQKGLTSKDTIHLLAAKVSKETIEWLSNTTKAQIKLIEVPSIDEYNHPYPNYCDIRINNFIPQYEYFMNEVTRYPDKLYYLANDDYLHIPDAIDKIKTMYSSGYKSFLVPQDYPDTYQDKNASTKLYLTDFGYLREVKSATPTFVAPGSLWLKYKYDILKAGVFADDGWTWRAFGLDMALAPMPGWSTHLQTNCESPYIDWYSLAKHYLGK